MWYFSCALHCILVNEYLRSYLLNHNEILLSNFLKKPYSHLYYALHLLSLLSKNKVKILELLEIFKYVGAEVNASNCWREFLTRTSTF